MKLSKKHEEQISELDSYLKANGIKHFSGREVLTLARAKIIAPVPPKKMWGNILAVLTVAMMIRQKMKCPLLVGNGYRPADLNRKVGGSRRSRHIHFRALDLDLPKRYQRRARQERFYKIAAEAYLNQGPALKMGLGIYRPNKGTRIHIDCGWKRRFWGGPKKSWIKDLLRENR